MWELFNRHAQHQCTLVAAISHSVVLAVGGTEVCNELVGPLATAVTSHIVRRDIMGVREETATTDCQVVYDVPESELRSTPCRTVLPMKEETLEQLSTSGLLVS